MGVASEPRLCRAREQRIERHERGGEWPVGGASSLLAERAERTPDRIFVVDGPRRMTFAEAERASLALAGGLLELGIGRGDVVSWQLPSWIEGALLTIALDRIGAIANPILPIYRENEVGFVVRQARSRALVVCGTFRGYDHRELATAVRRAAPELEHVLVARAESGPDMTSFDRLMAASSGASLPPSPFSPHEVSSIFYTSGTTSDPKGVLHTPSTLGSFARVNVRTSGIGEDDVSLLQFPLAHIGGIGAFVLVPLLAGSRTVYLDVWTPEAALDLIEREGVTAAGGPPAILQGILASPSFRADRVRSVRGASSGAADVSPELIRRVRRELAPKSFRSYGMTECPMVTSGRPDDPEEKCVMTDGRPGVGCEVKIVDDEGRELSPGEEGEVLVFGPQLAIGYLDGKLDEGAFTAEGFFRSGDLGVLDPDGYVRISGRKKDIIIRKGENLSAKSIEDVLCDHPKVADAAVVGVPDAERGERVCACVVLRPGVRSLDLAEIGEFMIGRGLMRQKIPEQLEILPELPRNATGKVKKFELRARFGRDAR